MDQGTTLHAPTLKIQFKIPVVVVAFKCHTGLDTYSIITPGTQFYTSHCKQGPPLSFFKSDAELLQESRRWHLRCSSGYSAELRQPAPFLPEPPQLILLANDLGWNGSCRAKPQLSGRRSHRWVRLSQLNPQAAGSDDAQDASYQQGVL